MPAASSPRSRSTAPITARRNRRASRSGGRRRPTTSFLRSRARASPPTGGCSRRPDRRSSASSPPASSSSATSSGRLTGSSWRRKKFDPDDFAAFLALLPASVEGRPIRHAVEVRHASFAAPEFVALARAHGVAVVVAGDSALPADRRRHRAVRLRPDHGHREETSDGLCGSRPRPLGRARARPGPKARRADDLETHAAPADAGQAREVFLYVISGAKQQNPAAAMALIERLG